MESIFLSFPTYMQYSIINITSLYLLLWQANNKTVQWIDFEERKILFLKFMRV